MHSQTDVDAEIDRMIESPCQSVEQAMKNAFLSAVTDAMAGDDGKFYALERIFVQARMAGHPDALAILSGEDLRITLVPAAKYNIKHGRGRGQET